MVNERNTRPVLYVDASGHQLEDPPMRHMTWHALAALITSIVAALGFLWNSAQGCADRVQNQNVQAASYEALANKVEKLYERVGALEQVLRMLPALFQKRQEQAERMVNTLHSPEVEPAPWSGKVKAVGIDAGPPVELAPPEALVRPKSGLPTFQKLQERVRAE